MIKKDFNVLKIAITNLLAKVSIFHHFHKRVIVQNVIKNELCYLSHTFEFKDVAAVLMSKDLSSRSTAIAIEFKISTAFSAAF